MVYICIFDEAIRTAVISGFLWSNIMSLTTYNNICSSIISSYSYSNTQTFVRYTGGLFIQPASTYSVKGLSPVAKVTFFFFNSQHTEFSEGGGGEDYNYI